MQVVAFDGRRPDFKSARPQNFQFNALETVNIQRCNDEYVILKFIKVEVEHEFIFHDPTHLFKNEFQKRFKCTTEEESDSSTFTSSPAVQAKTTKKSKLDESDDDEWEPQASPSSVQAILSPPGQIDNGNVEKQTNQPEMSVEAEHPPQASPSSVQTVSLIFLFFFSCEL